MLKTTWESCSAETHLANFSGRKGEREGGEGNDVSEATIRGT